MYFSTKEFDLYQPSMLQLENLLDKRSREMCWGVNQFRKQLSGTPLAVLFSNQDKAINDQEHTHCKCYYSSGEKRGYFNKLFSNLLTWRIIYSNKSHRSLMTRDKINKSHRLFARSNSFRERDNLILHFQSQTAENNVQAKTAYRNITLHII
ncbi:hypothetical protein CEXT_699981 [Caerostris extrusa]|uniref:Uncharacterized protein n=1 Tax=Caerostris extrusa TaxID=172846 RepID=A0AAV4TSA7_CAEEX|nr:hypothetical protein CEXT_699981 [Caerostris extrusa]